MARDFEDLHNLDDLNDTELQELARTHLRSHDGLDAAAIAVRAQGGALVLEGRVGTDAERRIAERVLTDVLGITRVTNNLVVDELRRAESPTDIDEHVATEEQSEGTFTDREVPFTAESEHLEEDLDARLYGTRDVNKAIGDGTPWIPPDAPTQEGSDSEPGTGEDR